MRNAPRRPPREAEALRAALEGARLELRAVFRALDRLRLAQHLPGELQRLMEVDADFGEALYVLDQTPAMDLDWSAMVHDTKAALVRMPSVLEALLATFDGPTRAMLEGRAEAVRGEFSPREAYRDIPVGRR